MQDAALQREVAENGLTSKFQSMLLQLHSHGELLCEHINYMVFLCSGQPPAPFCELLESTSPTSLSCTADREAVSRCNRVGFAEDLPADFQVSQASYSQPSLHAGRLGITMLYVFSVLLRSTIRWAYHFHRLLSYSRCE